MIDADELGKGMKLIDPTGFCITVADSYDMDQGEWFGEHEEFLTEVTVSAVEEGDSADQFRVWVKEFKAPAWIDFEYRGEKYIATA